LNRSFYFEHLLILQEAAQRHRNDELGLGREQDFFHVEVILQAAAADELVSEINMERRGGVLNARIISGDFNATHCVVIALPLPRRTFAREAGAMQADGSGRDAAVAAQQLEIVQKTQRGGQRLQKEQLAGAERPLFFSHRSCAFGD